MTELQQKNLESYRKSGVSEIPTSLENLLIEDCLEELQNFNSRFNFDKTCQIRTGINQKTGRIGFFFSARAFENLEINNQAYIILCILSRTPDGKAVMPFLEVEIKNKIQVFLINNKTKETEMNYEFTSGEADENKTCIIANSPKTLDHLLFREFTEALRVGKTFDEALELINKIYIDNIVL